MTVKINPTADAYGFLYASVTDTDGTMVSVSILPPKQHWSGDMVLAGYEPHATKWIVYADGEEIFRAARLDDVRGLLAGCGHDHPRDWRRREPN